MINKFRRFLKKGLNLVFCKKNVKWFILCFSMLGLFIPTIALTINEPDWIYINTAEEMEKMNDDLSGSYYIRNRQFFFNDYLPQIGTVDKPFTGTAYFDGTNIVFSNLQKNNNSCYGLFAYNKGTISGLTMYAANINVDSDDYGIDIKLGFICCINEGLIKNCTTNIHSKFICRSENNTSLCGTICAVNKGTISNCFCGGTVNNSNYMQFGGIAASSEHDSVIEECYVSTQYVFNGISSYVFGGIVGKLDNSKIQNCCAELRLYYSKERYDANKPSLGGLAGYLCGSNVIVDSYSRVELHINFDICFGAIGCELFDKSKISLDSVLSYTNVSITRDNFSHSFSRILSWDIYSNNSYYVATNDSGDSILSRTTLNADLFKRLGWSSNIWSFDENSNSIQFIRRYR